MLLRYEMGDESANKNGFYTAGRESALLPFRLMQFGEFHCGGRYFTEREGMDAFLFAATISGCGVMRYAGAEVLLPPGKAAVIDCSRYQYYGTKGERWDFAWIHFSGTAADGFVRMINGGGLRAADWEVWRAQELFGELSALTARPGRQADLMLSLWLHQLLGEMLQNAESRAAVRYQEEMLEAAAYIRENVSRPLRVSELAKRFGLSEYHFLRTFKSVVGRPPYEYLTLLRVNRAKQLLAGTSLNIGEISAEVGYPDPRSLIDNFRRHEGKTPSAFRRELLRGTADSQK